MAEVVPEVGDGGVDGVVEGGEVGLWKGVMWWWSAGFEVGVSIMEK